MLLFHEILAARALLKKGNVEEADAWLVRFLNNARGLNDDGEVLGEAERVMRRRHVASIVEYTGQIADEWKDGTYQNNGEVWEALRNVCSVASNTAAIETLRVTVYDDNLGEVAETATWRGRPPWDLLAQEACIQEVVADLKSDFGIDAYAQPPTERVVRCENCDEWKPPAKVGATECKACIEE